MKNQDDFVILVDEHDRQIGTCEKLAAHQDPQLHRAFSIFLIRKRNNSTEVLLQQRHPEKYHSGSLWANACCSHPRPDETVMAAANRRLNEELGITTKLNEIGSFIYKAELDNHLTEYEYDHILIGAFEDDNVPFNPLEVIATRWIEINTLKSDIENKPEIYVAWLKEALELLG